MKLNKIFILLTVCSMGFTSCDLDPEVYSDIWLDDYYKTPEQVATLVANAYSQLAGEHGYVYREGYWSMQEYTTDAVIVPTRGTDWYDNGVPIKMHTHTWEADTRDINNGWSFAYDGSRKCNEVLTLLKDIKGEDEMQYDEATKGGIAEAKVLRAFYHLLAMDIYGNAAIDDGRPLKQYSRTEIFNWIESEIKENLPFLSNTVRYGAVTAPVAHAMLAKLYLNAEIYTGTARWQDAVNECEAIINGGYGYALNADYFTTFKKDNEKNNKEIIFPVVFDAKYAEGNMFHLMTMHYKQQEVYGFTTQTWNGPCTLKSFYDKYADNDKRKAQWFVGPIQKDGVTLTYSNATLTNAPAIIVPEVTTIQDPTAANTFQGARFIKFEIEPGIGHHANSDFPIYRYADILLMKAEALMRLNGGTATSEALDLVNQVHTRAGLSPYTTSQLTLDELLNERGRELAWEGHRRPDLIRFGKFTNRTWDSGIAGITSLTDSPNRIVFPIPQWVLDANPGVYTQNNWR